MSQLTVYFNGGLYGDAPNKKFGAVRPTNGLPYVTLNPKGISLTSHHSSVYRLSTDLTRAYLVKDFGVVESPAEVELSPQLQDELRRACVEAENSNRWY